MEDEKVKQETMARIRDLKQRRGALLMAHNYVDGDIQDLADFVGDSLELSRQAARMSASLVVLAGVSFMAETAKVMCPGAMVLHPVPDAGCPMADMASAEDVAAYRRRNPDTVLVAYVNTTAAVKAEVDICCTSSNAEAIVASIPEDRRIMFLPDRNLGMNISRKLGRAMEFWPGFCPVHNRITTAMIEAVRAAHPGAPLLVHPECQPEVVAQADHVLSTGWMLKKVAELDAPEIIVGTESGILHRMRLENPGKAFIPLEPLPVCADMKRLTLASIADCLETLGGEVVLPEDVLRRARLPIERMLQGHL